ncbi:MAG: radical SAM protein [Candidatus Syntrophoarchaeum sp. WYZ-LMO15]|nr:MAG: radical SAM protein [Candidatus Syntrophoarchaeum sp. WYZ-LMO15]
MSPGCIVCGKKEVSKTLSLCLECIRRGEGGDTHLKRAHEVARRGFPLPPDLPRDPDGVKCNLCSNECQIGEGERGYCGLRENVRGRLISKVSSDAALACTYLDPLPTNCCAAWFCPESSEKGYNLATFFYGCNFDCLFCQNASHKLIDEAPGITIDRFVKEVESTRGIRCICYFGGSPEPQLPFAIRASERVIEERDDVRICWEWNGCGDPGLVMRAAELSFKSGGIIKFDLKAFNQNLSIALSGVSNKRAYENFEMIASSFERVDLLTATTPLIPWYIDAEEVEAIAGFIAGINPDIPYSLLVFHPTFYMSDMPITPRRQVEECYRAAKRHLKRVNIGNKHLLWL